MKKEELVIVNNVLKELKKEMPLNDALIIIASFLNINKLDVYKYLDKEIKINISSIIKEYKEGMPLNYITHSKDFYGYSFYVDERVLIPRYETEILVNKVLEYIDIIFKDKDINLLDIGSGSGIIGLTIKKERPRIDVSLSDISKDALDVTKINSDRLNLKVHLIESDLFKNINTKYNIIVSNPPYLMEGEEEKNTSKYEPHNALFEKYRCSYYEDILKDITSFLKEDFLIAFEINDGTYKDIERLINMYLNNVNYKMYRDLNNRERVVIITNKM